VPDELPPDLILSKDDVIEASVLDHGPDLPAQPLTDVDTDARDAASADRAGEDPRP